MRKRIKYLLLFLLKKLGMELIEVEYHTLINNKWTFFRIEKMIQIPRIGDTVILFVNSQNINYKVTDVILKVGIMNPIICIQ